MAEVTKNISLPPFNPIVPGPVCIMKAILVTMEEITRGLTHHISQHIDQGKHAGYNAKAKPRDIGQNMLVLRHS